MAFNLFNRNRLFTQNSGVTPSNLRRTLGFPSFGIKVPDRFRTWRRPYQERQSTSLAGANIPSTPPQGLPVSPQRFRRLPPGLPVLPQRFRPPLRPATINPSLPPRPQQPEEIVPAWWRNLENRPFSWWMVQPWDLRKAFESWKTGEMPLSEAMAVWRKYYGGA